MTIISSSAVSHYIYKVDHLTLRNYLTSTNFFFNETATTEIYTLSLHDALPIYNLYQINPAIVFSTPNVKINAGIIPSWDNNAYTM